MRLNKVSATDRTELGHEVWIGFVMRDVLTRERKSLTQGEEGKTKKQQGASSLGSGRRGGRNGWWSSGCSD